MYCLINVEQKGKFLSIYFSFIFSFWFFALGSGSTIFLYIWSKEVLSCDCALLICLRQISAPPKKKGKKTAADRSVWGLVSSRPHDHRLIVTSTELGLYLLSCIGKGPVLALIIEETQPRPQGTFPWPAVRLQSKGKAPWVRGWSKSHYALGWRKHVKHGN